MASGLDKVWKVHGDGRTVELELPPPAGAFGDPLVDPLAAAPDPRGSTAGP